jgi:hypothetical protein
MFEGVRFQEGQTIGILSPSIKILSSFLLSIFGELGESALMPILLLFQS